MRRTERAESALWGMLPHVDAKKLPRPMDLAGSWFDGHILSPQEKIEALVQRAQKRAEKGGGA